MNYALIALLITTCIAGTFGYWQYDRANGFQTALTQSETKRQQDQATAAAANKQQQNTIEQLKIAAMENQYALQSTIDAYNQITYANQYLINQTNKWRTRLDAESIKRPKVVARAARIAIRRSMRRAQCITDPACNVGPNGEALPDTPKTGPSHSPTNAKPDNPDAGYGKGTHGKGGSRGGTEVRLPVLQYSGSSYLSELGRRTARILGAIQKTRGGIREEAPEK